jgi:hypothetical protein
MSPRDGYDLWLESELRRRLHGLTAAPVPRARYEDAARGGRRSARLASGAGAALAAKAATGLVVAAFAVGATGTALSGSTNPASWEATAHQVVDQCKSGASIEGIGGCVSAIAEHPQPVAVATPENRPSTPSSLPPHAAPPVAAPVTPAPSSSKPAAPARTSDHAAPSAEAAPTPTSKAAIKRPRPDHTPQPSPRRGVEPSPSPQPTPGDASIPSGWASEHGQNS